MPQASFPPISMLSPSHADAPSCSKQKQQPGKKYREVSEPAFASVAKNANCRRSTAGIGTEWAELVKCRESWDTRGSTAEGWEGVKVQAPVGKHFRSPIRDCKEVVKDWRACFHGREGSGRKRTRREPCLGEPKGAQTRGSHALLVSLRLKLPARGRTPLPGGAEHAGETQSPQRQLFF